MDQNKKPEKSQQPSRNETTPDVPEKQTPTESEPRRYDEADPNWRNPDVQMRHGENPNVNTPKGIV